MIEILYDFENKMPKNVAIIDRVNVYVDGKPKELKSEKRKKTKNEVKKNGK